jgi:hypothetical protein
MFWQWFGNIFHRKNRKKSQMKLINKIRTVNSLLTFHSFSKFETDIFFSIAIDDFSIHLRFIAKKIFETIYGNRKTI